MQKQKTLSDFFFKNLKHSSSKKIFAEVYEYWRFVKILAGLSYNTYENKRRY